LTGRKLIATGIGNCKLQIAKRTCQAAAAAKGYGAAQLHWRRVHLSENTTCEPDPKWPNATIIYIRLEFGCLQVTSWRCIPLALDPLVNEAMKAACLLASEFSLVYYCTFSPVCNFTGRLKYMCASLNDVCL
jgi:hypothetical protein